MGSVTRVPPGRAGRLWLQHRLHTADRGAGLLDRKLRILRTEQEQRRRLADRTGAAWRDCCAQADAWLRRGALLGGQREIRLSQAAQPADVTIEWGAVMGVRYPRRATCRPGSGRETEHGPGTAALAEAAAAYRRALVAGADHVAALAACRIIEREMAQTRRLLRAIEDRWVPRLQGALRELTERLDEDERGETVRRRWAAARHGQLAGDHGTPGLAGHGWSDRRLRRASPRGAGAVYRVSSETSSPVVSPGARSDSVLRGCVTA